jgi:hypothetical protein
MRETLRRAGCLLALTLAVAAASAAPLPPVGTIGDEFVIGDQAFRFVGVNLRGIAHYGGGDILPYTTATNRTENLDGVVAMGGKVIRIFAPIPQISVATNIARLGTLLDECEARGLRVIVALTDFYFNSGFRVPGDDGYYAINSGGYNVLTDAWFAGGYQVNYLPWVQAVVNAYKDHSAVFAWEIGNELTDAPNIATLRSFASTTAAAIRAIDPDTLITFGGLGVNHFGVDAGQGMRLFDDPNIDFVTVHTYDGATDADTYRVAWALEKPIVVEETGNTTSYTSDRPATLTAQMADWIDSRDARGIMQWGYQVETHDIGDGDALFGMDPNFFAFDWDGMNAAYSARAQTFANNPVTVTPVELPSGENVALGSVAWATSSNYNSLNTGAQAIDGVIGASSKWTSDGTSPTSWLALDLGAEYRLTGAIVRSAGSAYEVPGYNLVALQIQTGPSLSGPWTTQFNHSDDHPPNRAVCLFPTPVVARFVRLLVTDAGIDNYARVPEFEVYGTPNTTATPMGMFYR